MKSLIYTFHLLLVLTSIVFNIYLSKIESIESLTVVAFYNLNASIYFVQDATFGKKKLLYNPKYYCAFPISYWSFLLNSFFKGLIKNYRFIPFILSPFAIFFSDLPINKSLLIFFVEYTVALFTLFILLFIYQQFVGKKLKINIISYLVFVPLLFYMASLRMDSNIPMAFNITGGFWILPLMGNFSNFLVKTLIVLGISTSILALTKRISLKWPGF